MGNSDLLDAMDNMASSFWCMFDQPESRDLKPVPSEDAYSFPECDYEKNPTNLYKQIEGKNWTAVNHFLLTGYWSGSFFADTCAPTVQACTWVTKYDPNTKRKKVMWTHLPIHAALSFGAPEGVIQLLVKLAPPTLRCADDQRMLPLHLAFRRGATDATIAVIMDVFPEGVAVRDFLGRTPAECSSEGPNPKRGTIIQTVLYYNQKAWEKKAAKAQEKHLASVRETLQQRTEKVEHIQTAFDLVRTRDDQTKNSFKMVMGELSGFKGWFDAASTNELVANGGSLSASFVKELSDRLDTLHDTANALNAQNKKAKKESDKTLKELKSVWDVNGWSEGLKMRSFADMLSNEEDPSEAESITSLITHSTAKKEEKVSKAPLAIEAEEAKSAAKEQEVEPEEESVEAELEEKVEEPQEKPAETPKQEPAKSHVEISLQGTPKVVGMPDVVSVQNSSKDDGSENEIKPAISEMTSLDMSEHGDAASKASASSKKKAFRLGLSKITKMSSSKSKKQGSKASLDGKSLPPKAPLATTKKPGKLAVLKGGSVKVCPTV